MGILPLLTQPPAVVAPKQAKLDTLAAVAPNLYWNVAERGALLVVAPEKYALVSVPRPIDFFQGGLTAMMAAFGGDEVGEETRKALGLPTPPKAEPLPAAPRGGWNVSEVLPRFGSQLVRCGTITAVAPQLLPDRRPKKDAFPDSNELVAMVQEQLAAFGGTRLLPFLATLSPSQLQQAGSEGGLPLSSLSNTQLRAVRPLLPRTLSFTFAEKPNLPDSEPLANAPLIPESDQAQFRIRLTRRLNVAPKVAGLAGLPGPGAQIARQAGNLLTPPPSAGGVRELSLRPGTKPNPLAMLGLLGGNMNDTGVPARRKPSDLDPNSGTFNPSIALSGATTVEMLVARIAQATKVNLIADRKIANLKVLTRGERVRAGDVLQALCSALGGAARRLSDGTETVYLLTEDVALPQGGMQGMMTQLIQPMAGMMQNQKASERLAADAKIRLIRQKALNAVPRGYSGGLPERFWAVAEQLPDPKDASAGQLPITELPAEMQKRAEEFNKAFSVGISAAQKAQGKEAAEPEAVSTVYCGQSLVAELVAPSLGATATLATTDANEINPNLPTPTPPPPTVLSEKLAVRAALVPLPIDASQAEQLVASAVARGLTELRVPLTTGATAETALAALAAKAQGKIGVVPVLCPLTPLTPETPRDRSFAGLTLQEWTQTPSAQKLLTAVPMIDNTINRSLTLDFTTPEAADVTGFAAWVKRLLALPGVTGAALDNLAAPGYREAGNGNAGMFFWEGGASASERVAFVKTEHSDPAELANLDFSNMFQGMGARMAWTKRTTARSDAFLKRLDTALTASKLPTLLSTLVGGEPPRWERWTGVYPSGTTLSTKTRPALRQLAYSRLLTMNAVMESNEFAGFNEDEQFAGVLGKELTKLAETTGEARFDGVVIDLSDQPFAKAIALLERAIAAK